MLFRSIGQHIHLPKWDLTTTDGSANGWNYEDGTLSPGAVRERIEAIRAFNGCTAADPRNGTNACPEPKAHPFFGQFGRTDWVGARTTMQRWFADPVVNTEGVDRGLGIIFTHDHYGPSTHQQIGLYATVLTEPAVPTTMQGTSPAAMSVSIWRRSASTSSRRVASIGIQRTAAVPRPQRSADF